MLIKSILSNINKIVDDIIVIECPLELLQNAIDCIGFKLDRVFFAIETLEKDVYNCYVLTVCYC